MNTGSVMQGVTFRTLYNIAKPLRCTYIRMLKYTQEVCRQDHHGDCLWGKSGNKTKANASEYSPANHIERTKIKCSISIYTFGTVVDLVKKISRVYRCDA